MPSGSSLRGAVIGEFTKAFGAPTLVTSTDTLWVLRALPYLAAVNVLVFVGDQTIVWFFDPHDSDDGHHREIIETTEQIGGIAKLISARVRRAGGRD
jgi:hypothetical protein